MIMTRRLAGTLLATMLIASQSFAQVDLGLYEKRGDELYNSPASCAVCHKRDGTGHFGRTPSVLKADTGQQVATFFSGYEVDHLLLSPNGKEMWATSNGEGRIYVYNAATHEQISVIQMPQNGDPHGLDWVHYDKEGNSKLVRDQGGFHGGVNPALGRALDH